MTTIARFAQFQQADLVRARLEAAGVRCFYPDESSGTWVLGAAPIVGGVSLQVADEDADRARELLSAPPLAEPGV